MTSGSCQVGSESLAVWRKGIFWAFAMASGAAAICAAPAKGADWDHALQAPGLRMPDSMLSLREMYPDLALPKAAAESSHEFQSHTGAFPTPTADADYHPSGALERSGDLPLTSSWQRMSDFRSEDGIRLLTVWQSANSTLAVHQGKHGGASLQWTSQVMNRGGASRGLFDHLISTVRDVHMPLHTSTGIGAATLPGTARFAAP